MNIDVVLLPQDLQPEHLRDRVVVVFDVLRATSTMTAALAAGVKEIRIFDRIDGARTAARSSRVPHLLCGETHAVKPPGFDLGNSPGVFNASEHRDLTLFMATTNGTRAIVAAEGAPMILIVALINAAAVAQAVCANKRDVTLLCSGTEGEISLEDVLGAGAVLSALDKLTDLQLLSDRARIARALFQGQRDHLLELLTSSRGGQNIIRAGLTPDIAFCAKLNSFSAVGVVRPTPPIVTLWKNQR
jgi:2-phosphosulfolactate phosphatase